MNSYIDALNGAITALQRLRDAEIERQEQAETAEAQQRYLKPMPHSHEPYGFDAQAHTELWHGRGNKAFIAKASQKIMLENAEALVTVDDDFQAGAV